MLCSCATTQWISLQALVSAARKSSIELLPKFVSYVADQLGSTGLTDTIDTDLLQIG